MSFYCSDNLVEKEEQPIPPITFFDGRDRESLKFVLCHQIKADLNPGQN